MFNGVEQNRDITWASTVHHSYSSASVFFATRISIPVNKGRNP